MAVSIASWNVNGIRARESQLLEWLAEAQPDVLCLQEIKAAPSQLPTALVDLEGYWSYWHGQAGGYSGVSLHFRHGRFPDQPEFAHPAFDMESRIVQAELEGIVFASVYVPNGGKDYAAKLAFLESLQTYVRDVHAASLQLVLCGDMNVALTDMDIHPTYRKPGLIGTRPDERKLLQGVITQDLVDVARHLEPDNDRLFTWWPFWRTARERNLGWRLDLVLASEELGASATSFDVFRNVGSSDHAPVVATFRSL